MLSRNEDHIKTIVFDLGGVYFTRGSHLAIEKIIDIYSIEDHHSVREFFRDSYKKEGHMLRLGLINMDEFEQRFVSNFDIKIDDLHHIRNIWFGSYLPHYKMEEIVMQLKKYRLIIFSGNIKERIEFLDKRYDFLKFFDVFLFSYEYQKNKNDIEFYKELLNHLNCEPSEALIIDDEKKNIKLAESLGLNAILYYYTEQLVKELRKYNITINI
ncbi:MAG: HAD-IA family hydrolase [Promethearchaeota archaeon]